MSKRNYLNVVSAGVAAFGTLAIGLVSVLPMTGFANAKWYDQNHPVCPKGTTFNSAARFCEKSTTKPEAKDDMAQLADLEKAGNKAQAKRDKAREESNKASAAGAPDAAQKAVAYKTAMNEFKAAKENLAKFAESKGLDFIAKQVRGSKKLTFTALANLVRDGLKAPVNPTPTPAPVNPTPAPAPVSPTPAPELGLGDEERGKKTPENKPSETPAKRGTETPAATPESKTQPSAGKDAYKGQQHVKKGHHKYGAPNTGYEF